MSTKITFKRGTEAQVNATTPDSGEPVWKTDTKELVVGDGATAGGIDATTKAHAPSHTDGTDDIQDAAADDSTKGIATFEADDFDSASGKIDLADAVAKSVSTDGSAATPSTHALTIAGGTGITTSGAGATVTITGDDAAADDTTKGVATFEADDFDSSSGKIDLAVSVTKASTTDSGTATPTAHDLNIVGGEGINTSGAGAVVTIAGEDASDTNKGIASFDAQHFTVTSGNVDLNIDDTPVNNETDEPITSNWAYGHENSSSGHPTLLVTSEVAQAFKAEYNITTDDLATYVHGVKVELTRAADIQPSNGCWFGGQFVLNAGTDSYTDLDKPAYVLQGIFKGNDVTPNGVDINVARFEVQSAGTVGEMVYLIANTGCAVSSMLELATHIVPSTAMQRFNVQSSQTVLAAMDFITGAGSSFNYGLDLSGATINTADIRFSNSETISGLDDTPVNAATSSAISSNWAFDHNANATAHQDAPTLISDHAGDADAHGEPVVTCDTNSATADDLAFSVVGGEGIDTSGATSVVTITAEDASTTNKGIVQLDDTAGGTDAEVAKPPTSNVMYDHGIATTGVHGAGANTILYSDHTADVDAHGEVVITTEDSNTATSDDLALTFAAGEGINTTSTGTTVTIAGEAASTTNIGVVELATGAETNTGTSATLAVTPDGLDDWTGSAQITTVGTLSSGDVTAQVSAATTSAAGKSELAIASEINAGDETAMTISPKELSDSNYGKRIMYIKVLANDTALATGDGKAIVTIPIELNGMNLVLAHAAVYTTSSSGNPAISLLNLDGGNSGTDMLSTSITIDASELTSYTASTPPVIDGGEDDVATSNRISVNVDVAGTDTTGLDVILTFQLP